MKKNKFSVVKLLLFLMIFLVILTLFLTIYIIPSMKKYKTNETVLKRYEKLYKKKKSEIARLKSKRKYLEKSYEKEINKYSTTFNEDVFLDFLKKYSHEPKIIKKSSEKGKLFYTIELNIDNMNFYYNMIENINKYPNIVKISFPITIIKEDKLYKVIQNVTILHGNLKKRL